jgi:hypothetical protein
MEIIHQNAPIEYEIYWDETKRQAELDRTGKYQLESKKDRYPSSVMRYTILLSLSLFLLLYTYINIDQGG